MKENIVFFFSDQQRYDTLGCNGQPLPVTPQIDALAAEGVNFKQTFTMQPVCGPARSCLQTGLYATQTGCYRNAISLPLDADTLAYRMRGAGYDVAYVGKWHLASDEHENHYETKAVPLERRGGYNDYWRAADVLEFTSHGYGGYVFDENGSKHEFQDYRTDCITDYALEYIRQHNQEKPFFLFLSHIEPHHQNDHEDYEGPNGSKQKYAQFKKPDDLQKGVGDWEQFYPDYLGCCNALDNNLGRIVQALHEKGIYDNTTIVYTSDHGCHFRNNTDKVAEGYDDYKRNSFENTIHVPLIIKGKHFFGGRSEQKLVSLLDLPKTLLEIAGANLPENWQGTSLVGIEGKSVNEWNDHVYIQISESYVGRCVRTQQYKYVVWAPDRHPWNDSGSKVYEEKYLFDIKADPLEKNNLVHSAAHTVIKAELRRMLIDSARKAGEGDIEILIKQKGDLP